MDIEEHARNAAVAEIFAVLASDEKSDKLLGQIRLLSDADYDLMGRLQNVPDSQLPIFRSMMRGEHSTFLERLGEFGTELRTGDLILVTGKSASSKALVASQKPFYINARSSHVAVVHADFICVDAMPNPGVSNRLVSEVLEDVESDWRVIRFNGLDDTYAEPLQKQCAHYIMQPYKITLKRKKGKDYSYCSELARKVFEGCEIADTGIPQHALIKPCDFDRIADCNEGWTDITENVRPYVEFAIEFAPLLRVVSKLFIGGLKLNRSRYEERRALLKMVEAAKRKGRMSPERAAELNRGIQRIEESLHFTFWDFKKLTPKPSSE